MFVTLPNLAAVRCREIFYAYSRKRQGAHPAGATSWGVCWTALERPCVLIHTPIIKPPETTRPDAVLQMPGQRRAGLLSEHPVVAVPGYACDGLLRPAKPIAGKRWQLEKWPSYPWLPAVPAAEGGLCHKFSSKHQGLFLSSDGPLSGDLPLPFVHSVPLQRADGTETPGFTFADWTCHVLATSRTPANR